MLFNELDSIKVCDLGIATARTDEDELETELTRTNTGSLLYMSPEQVSISSIVVAWRPDVCHELQTLYDVFLAITLSLQFEI